jgi:hypothetical protein
VTLSRPASDIRYLDAPGLSGQQLDLFHLNLNMPEIADSLSDSLPTHSVEVLLRQVAIFVPVLNSGYPERPPYTLLFGFSQMISGMSQVVADEPRSRARGPSRAAAQVGM